MLYTVLTSLTVIMARQGVNIQYSICPLGLCPHDLILLAS